MSLQRNTLYSFATFGSRILSGTILMFFFARLLPKNDFGDISYAVSLSSIVLVASGFGYPSFLTREVSQGSCPPGTALMNTLVPKLAIAALVLATTGLFLRESGLGPDLRTLVWIFSIGAVLNTFTQHINAIQKGMNNFLPEALVSFMQNAGICIGCVITVTWYQAGTVVIGMIYGASYAVGCFLAVIAFLHKKGNRPLMQVFQLRQSMRLLRESSPFGITAVVLMLYLQIDTIIIGNYLGSDAVARYHAAMRPAFAFMLVPEILMNAYYPTIAASFVSRKQNGHEASRSLVTMLVLFGACFCLLTAIYSDVIMNLLYGGKYDAEAPILFLFSFVILIRYAAMSYGIIIAASKNQGLQCTASIIATGISALLNILLVPRFGIAAAVFTLMVTNTMIFLFYLYSVRRLFGFLFVSREMAPGLILIAGIGILGLILRYLHPLFGFAAMTSMIGWYAVKTLAGSNAKAVQTDPVKEFAG